MNRNMGLLVQGAALLVVSAVCAAASPMIPCGSVGSAGNGNVAFTSSSGDASASGGSGTITCAGFAVPSGQTLIGVVVEITDDALESTGADSQITWNWSYSGESLTPTPGGTFTEDGNAGLTFGGCSGTGTLACDTTATFDTAALYTGPVTTGSFTFDVTPSVTGTGGAGLGADGSDSASVSIEFLTSGATAPPTVPEPASLLLMGSVVIALAGFARRKRWN